MLAYIDLSNGNKKKSSFVKCLERFGSFRSSLKWVNLGEFGCFGPNLRSLAFDTRARTWRSTSSSRPLIRSTSLAGGAYLAPSASSAVTIPEIGACLRLPSPSKGQVSWRNQIERDPVFYYSSERPSLPLLPDTWCITISKQFRWPHEVITVNQSKWHKHTTMNNASRVSLQNTLTLLT